MKERGLLLKDRLVRATLRPVNPKTQTRRLIKPQPPEGWNPTVGHYNPTVIRRGMEEPGPEVFGASDEDAGRVCPYGQPGDRLWVREAWAHNPDGDSILYRADYGTGDPELAPRWKPGIHLFRRDSRILLEVVTIRVERIQDISDEDAIAEGLEPDPNGWRGVSKTGANAVFAHPRMAFASLWDSINGDRPGASWDANPWVWVITFRRVTP